MMGWENRNSNLMKIKFWKFILGSFAQVLGAILPQRNGVVRAYRVPN